MIVVALWGDGQTVIPRSKSPSFHPFNMCFLLLSFQQVSGQIAVWPGRCGLEQLWERMKRGLWVERSQPGKETSSPVAKALDGFANEWLRAGVAASLCHADPPWLQMEMVFCDLGEELSRTERRELSLVEIVPEIPPKPLHCKQKKCLTLKEGSW